MNFWAVVAIGLYLWAGMGTGLMVSRLYEPNEHNRVIGPIVWGVMWPMTLPIAGLALRSPPWHLQKETRGQ